MSEFGNERVMANARAMGEEDLKVFLTQVDRRLLSGEIDRRMEKLERLEKRGKELFAEE